MYKFDPEFYSYVYSDVSSSELSPDQHWMRSGVPSGRVGSMKQFNHVYQDFDWKQYLKITSKTEIETQLMISLYS